MNHSELTPRSPLASRVALRVAVGLVAFLALGGPSPGYVGGCRGSGPVARTSPNDFCIGSQSDICIRELYSGRTTTEAEYNACFAAIAGYCAARQTWSEGCLPEETTLAACRAALQDPARYPTLSADIGECMSQVICPPTGI